MKTFAAVILCIGALASIPEPVQSLPDCRSYFRILYPQLFTHCNCEYSSSWSQWEDVPDSIHPVPTSQCPSGQAYTERRTQEAIGEGCNPRIEIRRDCMPDLTDRLIMALGLGDSGQNTTAIQPPIGVIPYIIPDISPNFNLGRPAPTSPTYKRKRRQAGRPFCGSKRICHDYLQPTGKRSSPAESLQQTSHYVPSQTETEEAPLPFEWKQHHHRFRRQQQCSRNDVQHVLFLLDTSGSISSDSFTRMKEAVGRLIFHFCRQVQVAVMTFDHTFNIEFCFDCYDNTCHERGKAYTAIAGITQRGGLTHTGGATLCACNVLLKQQCGLPPTARCISVVYITDGQSNDPSRRVCDEVRCLHERAAVETFAIGIGNNIDQDELQCIGDFSNFKSPFNFESFAEFEAAVKGIEKRFIQSLNTTATPAPGQSPYQCPNAIDGEGGQSCIPDF